MTYVIAEWRERFETAETRKLANLQWSPAPNKLDGLGYRRMVQQRDRCELFSAWNILRAIASKTQPKEARGRLERDGKPLTAEDLSLMSGFPAPIFERALSFFSSPEMQWLLLEESRTDSATAADPESESGQSPARPADIPAPPASPPAVQKGMEGKELNYPADAGPEFRTKFVKWMQERRGRGKKPKDWSEMFQEQLDWLTGFPEAQRIEILSQSIRNGWQGLFESKGTNGTHQRPAAQGRSVGTANEGRAADYSGIGKVT